MDERAVVRSRNPRGQGERLREELLRATERLLEQVGSEDALSLRAVAREAGVAAPSIYRHFPDKTALVWATLEVSFERLARAMADAAARTGPPVTGPGAAETGTREPGAQASARQAPASAAPGTKASGAQVPGAGSGRHRESPRAEAPAAGGPGPDAALPVERLRAQLRAYCRYAVEHPAKYRLLYETRQTPVGPERLVDHPAGLLVRCWREELAACEAAGWRVRCDSAEAPYVLWSAVHGRVMLWQVMPSRKDARRLDRSVDEILHLLLER